MDSTCTIVVPAYKKEMSPTELTSFVACCRVFGPSHRIVLATHPKLDLKEYRAVAAGSGIELGTEFFPKRRFRSIHAYNLLMTDAAFYRRFLDTEYILIYQLDCYVFEDKLAEWCAKGYDYVGAPLFAPGADTLEGASVGNGGFSLRRTAAFEKCLSSWIFPIAGMRHDPYVTGRKRLLYFNMLLFSGISTKIRGFFTHWVDEDRFFSHALKGTARRLKTPTPEEALGFSFDMQPDACLRLSGGKLPMGCHQWHNFKDFWKQYIKL